MDKKLRWGIISCGYISQDFCASIDLTKHELVACASRNLNDAQSFAKRFNIKNYYDSYELVYNHEQVDCVYIGSIISKHKEQCLAAIKANKHVLCEKALCLNSKEEDEIFDALKNKNLFFMEAIWTRFFPIIDRLRKELANNTIGDVKCVQCNFCIPQIGVPRLELKELGGGACLDLGIYPIHLACLAFDHEEPIEIKAVGHLLDTGVDRCESISIKYKDGKLASLMSSGNCVRHSNMVIIGTKGVIQLPRNAWCPTEMILPNGEHITSPLPDLGPMNFLNSSGLRYEADAVRDAIFSGSREHPYMTWNHSRLIMRIIDKIHEEIGYKVFNE